MGLINLKTDLKSLRYGKDRIDGGDSGQPYIKTKIPDDISPYIGTQDYINRGGINVVRDSATDILRLGKMFISTKSPNGIFFTTKQLLLSRTANRTQTSGILNEGIYTPLNTLAQAGVVAFGGHLNKQGLNPFTETGAYSNNNNLYGVRIKSTQPITENRLVLLYSGSFVENKSYDLNGIKLNDGQNVLTYVGGPGSILGFGKTGIRYINAINRTGVNNYQAKAPEYKDYFYGTGYQTSIAPDVYRERLNSTGSNTIKSKFEQYAIGNDFENYKYENAYQSQDETGKLNPLFTTNKLYFYGKGYQTSVSPNTQLLNELLISGSLTLKGYYEAFAKESGILDYEYNNEYQTQAQTGKLNPLFVDNPGYFFGTSGSVFVPGDYLRSLSSIDNKGVSGKYSRLTNVKVPNNFNPEGQLVDNYNNSVYEVATEGNTWPKNSPLIYDNNTFTYTQQDIINTNINPPSAPKSSPKTQDFRKVLREKLGVTTEQGKAATDSGATSLSLSYNVAQNQTIEGRVRLGDPGARSNKSYASYADGVIDVSSGKSPYPNYNIPGLGTPVSSSAGLDRINSIPLYRSENVTTDLEVNDLCKFRIAIIDNNSPNFKNFIHFRAYLDNISDSYNATWNNFQYLGRGENFYTYGGFTRTISLGWTVVAQSKQELIPMYKKLNYLASTLAPDYSPIVNGAGGYMRGTLCQLTIGGYLYEQPGFITSLTYDISSETTWEIGVGTEFDTGNGATTIQGDSSVKELPHMIKVTGFSFTPIQKFLPRSQANNYGGAGFVQTYGPERYISLANGVGADKNNYDS
jgi:hypothetical protein